MEAVDTNVLIYAHDPRDQAKQATAIALVKSLTQAALLWQVACEYLSASRKLEPLGYSRVMAWQDIRQLRRVWTTVLASWSAFDRAEQLLGSYSFSFWESLIVAVCLEAGVSKLYSEAYPVIGGLQIINPFKLQGPGQSP